MLGIHIDEPVSPSPVWPETTRRRMEGRCPICRERVYAESVYSKHERYQEELDPAFQGVYFKSIVTHIGESIVDHVRKEHGRKMSYTCTSAGVWDQWTSTDISYQTVTDTSHTGDTWTYWTADSTSTSTATISVVWTDWTDAVVTHRTADRSQYYNEYPRETENEYPRETENEYPRETENDRAVRIARQEREREAFARKAKERQEKEKKIQDTARDLLREVLTEEQNNQLDKHGYFELKLANGNIYHIYKGYSHNVKRIDQCGRQIESLCFHPGDLLPDYDTMAMQKLMLEANEEQARKSANVRLQ